jgi:hypothetical protein
MLSTGTGWICLSDTRDAGCDPLGRNIDSDAS